MSASARQCAPLRAASATGPPAQSCIRLSGDGRDGRQQQPHCAHDAANHTILTRASTKLLSAETDAPMCPSHAHRALPVVFGGCILQLCRVADGPPGWERGRPHARCKPAAVPQLRTACTRRCAPRRTRASEVRAGLVWADCAGFSVGTRVESTADGLTLPDPALSRRSHAVGRSQVSPLSHQRALLERMVGEAPALPPTLVGSAASHPMTSRRALCNIALP